MKEATYEKTYQEICRHFINNYMFDFNSYTTKCKCCRGKNDYRQHIDYGDPIEVIRYTDENGCEITESIYFKADDEVPQSKGTSGAGWYRNEKSFNWDNGLSRPTIYYAEGYFVWGNGDISESGNNI